MMMIDTWAHWSDITWHWLEVSPLHVSILLHLVKFFNFLLLWSSGGPLQYGTGISCNPCFSPVSSILFTPRSPSFNDICGQERGERRVCSSGQCVQFWWLMWYCQISRYRELWLPTTTTIIFCCTVSVCAPLYMFTTKHCHHYWNIIFIIRHWVEAK